VAIRKAKQRVRVRWSFWQKNPKLLRVSRIRVSRIRVSRIRVSRIRVSRKVFHEKQNENSHECCTGH
jgi:hypothetical protein